MTIRDRTVDRTTLNRIDTKSNNERENLQL